MWLSKSHTESGHPLNVCDAISFTRTRWVCSGSRQEWHSRTSLPEDNLSDVESYREAVRMSETPAGKPVIA